MHPYRELPKGSEFTLGEEAWFESPLRQQALAGRSFSEELVAISGMTLRGHLVFYSLVLLVVLLTGCVRLPHVDPQPRDEDTRMRAAVRVESYCMGDGVTGSGVVISERHVLTAAHVTACPDIPTVFVTVQGGIRHRAVVTREDAVKDIARLEVAHAGSFGLRIPPPKLTISNGSGYLCAYIKDEGAVCGDRLDVDVYAANPEPGDSGAGVYDGDHLVGLIIRAAGGLDSHLDPFLIGTRVAIVDATWLAGT